MSTLNSTDAVGHGRGSLLELAESEGAFAVSNPDPIPPADAKPAWLPRLQLAMASVFVLGAVVTGLSGYSVFIIAAFAIDAGIVVWMMQQPWAKALVRRS